MERAVARDNMCLEQAQRIGARHGRLPRSPSLAPSG